MKAKSKKSEAESAPFDPVLFAATVPSRKPTAEDIEASAPHPDDLIEPKSHASMQGIIADL